MAVEFYDFCQPPFHSARGNGNELLHSLALECVAEVRILELAFENPLLLLLETPA
jgi:hypothetical protein